MQYFFDTVETIDPGLGFELYGCEHFVWLAVFVLFALGSSVMYKKHSGEARRKMQILFAVLIVGNELFKMTCLTIGGNYRLDYLPLHLCSINIILIALHTIKPSEALDNFLYMVCIPGAMVALLFPTWTELPRTNFMYWHSFTVHILLATYPLMLTVGGDIKPKVKKIPQSLLILLGLAAVVFCFNLIFDTNFMFLMYAEEGNPLLVFEALFGKHWLGFPIIIAGILVVMYTIPLWFFRKINADGLFK